MGEFSYTSFLSEIFLTEGAYHGKINAENPIKTFYMYVVPEFGHLKFEKMNHSLNLICIYSE